MTDLLKLNEEEMWIISDWLASPDGGIDEQIECIQTRFPNIKEIILTRGSLRAVYFSANEQISVDAYPVEVKDTIGSGDAFLAAFLANKMKGRPTIKRKPLKYVERLKKYRNIYYYRYNGKRSIMSFT